MTPIVHGLQDQFNADVHFEFLVANDGGAGEAAFNALDLRGHPTVVIILPDGEEVFRGFGVLDADLLAETLENLR